MPVIPSFKQYLLCLSYPSLLPTHSHTTFIKILVVFDLVSPFLLFLSYLTLISHFSQTNRFGSTKNNTWQTKSTIIRAIGSFFFIVDRSRSREKLKWIQPIKEPQFKKLIEHNRSTRLGFLQLLNSILKISYMATGLIRNKSHFSKGIFGLFFLGLNIFGLN